MVGTAITSVVHDNDTPYETATFGMGCFWGADSLFGSTYGTLRTKVGYSGGSELNPVYRNLGDHTEVISIDFDPTKITYNQLLDLFWNNHEYGLTTRIKRQYMSLILTHSDEQKAIAEKSRTDEQIKRKPELIITEIQEAGVFYPAEEHKVILYRIYNDVVHKMLLRQGPGTGGAIPDKNSSHKGVFSIIRNLMPVITNWYFILHRLANSYHQKYRLQSHKDFTKTLDLTPERLLTSHVAAKLNGYLVGVGGVKQFLSEAYSFGLDDTQREYVRHYVEKNEGGSLYC